MTGLYCENPRVPPLLLCWADRGGAHDAEVQPHWRNAASTNDTLSQEHPSLVRPIACLFSCQVKPFSHAILRFDVLFFPLHLLLLWQDLHLFLHLVETSPAAYAQIWSPRSGDKAVDWSLWAYWPSKKGLMGPKSSPGLTHWTSLRCFDWDPAVKAEGDPPVLDPEAWYYLGSAKLAPSPFHYYFYPHQQREMLEMSGGRSFGCVH